MKHILFVDDEPKILEAMENMLFDGPEDWEPITAPGGRAALEILASSPVDVLVTDMRMPEMDGAELLEEVRRRHPRVLRFVLTGHAETKPLLQALDVSHQVLSKPCSSEFLINAIQRAIQLEALMADGGVRTLVGRLKSLPLRPRLYTEVSRLLARETTSLPEISAVIETDVAVSAKVLKVANTAFFSRGQRCSTIPEALARLGLGLVQGVLLEVEAGSSLGAVPEKLQEEINERSRAVAALARRIGGEFECANEAFIAGILSHIGKLLFAAILPDAYREFRQKHAGVLPGPEEEAAERACLGASHAELGGYLLGLWGLPYPVIEAVANHHAIGRIETLAFGPLEAVQIACRLVDLETRGGEEAFTAAELDHLARFGVLDRIDGWRDQFHSMQEKAA